MDIQEPEVTGQGEGPSTIGYGTIGGGGYRALISYENATVKVLDHGELALEEHMGGDISVVNAARVSFAKQVNHVDAADVKVIRSLMKNRHGTPFEHNYFKFRVKCPIFVAREWMRHRIGSFNEWSGRYSKLDPEFYLPEESQMRRRVGNAMSYTYEPLDKDIAKKHRTRQRDMYFSCYFCYEDMLKEGVAPEVARLILPVATYTQFIWTVNCRSLMNFLSLRTHATAQYEIRKYADEIVLMFHKVMPITCAAWNDNDRIAP